jgi:hypothetical protein
LGSYWWSFPLPLANWARKILAEDAVVVETGTYLGDSAEYLSQKFARVITFERDPILAKNAEIRFSNNLKVKVVEGSTRETFERNIPSRDVPCLFWLDAHYSGGITAGEDDPCPLLHELGVIFQKRSLSNTVLIIDDVREMIGGGSDWPTLVEVCAILHKNGFNGIFFDDTLVVVDASNLQSLLDLREKSRAVILSRVNHHWNLMMRVASVALFFGNKRKRVMRIFSKN